MLVESLRIEWSVKIRIKFQINEVLSKKLTKKSQKYFFDEMEKCAKLQ